MGVFYKTYMGRKKKYFSYRAVRKSYYFAGTGKQNRDFYKNFTIERKRVLQ